MYLTSSIKAPKLDVFALGSPLIDITVNVDESQLSSFGIAKGEQLFVDEDVAKAALQRVDALDKRVGVGGCVRNAIQGLSLFGERAAFFSTVGSDEHGELIRRNLQANHIQEYDRCLFSLSYT